MSGESNSGNGSNEYGLNFVDKGELSNPKITVIGPMDVLANPRLHQNPNINTWWKTGRVPERGLDGDGTAPISWLENRKWLDQWIDAGHRFAIAVPENRLSKTYEPGVPNGYFTYRELEHLREQGIDVEDWSELF